MYKLTLLYFQILIAVLLQETPNCLLTHSNNQKENRLTEGKLASGSRTPQSQQFNKDYRPTESQVPLQMGEPSGSKDRGRGRESHFR